MSISSAFLSNVVDHSETKKSNSLPSTMRLISRQPTADISHQSTSFTPELVENSQEDEYRYSFPGPGRFLCDLTKIVFEMKCKGEVKYKMISWDNWILNKLPQMEPAGPLYNIDGPDSSIQRLHLPYGETGKGKEKLALAHVTDGDVEIIQPQTVTETHVIINVQSLSPFGLISPWNSSTIRAQVLLFYKKKTEHSKSKLNVHLLPANVPVKEVQKQLRSYKYIKTTSSCELTPGRKYRLHYRKTDNTDNTDNTVLQPEVVEFEWDCCPNYHPTFEILNIDAAEFSLILSDKKGKEVWKQSVDLPTGPLKDLVNLDTAECLQDSSEHNGTKKDLGPTSILQPYPGHLKPFTPELVENSDEDEYRYFFPGPGQFLCDLTNIVFEMESEGEVKYRIIPWNNWILDKLSQTEPAGPLYNIDGPEGSVRRLHFPHCEIGKGKGKLTVSHVNDGDVEIIHPQTVTETHVIINVQSLSPFGLTSPWKKKSIKAQVLLFYKKQTEDSKSKLNVHLLPANVPVKEVQKKQQGYKYIKTASGCKLTPGQKYRLHFTSTDNTDNTVLQPEVVKFQRDSSPNYHPSFEILNINAGEVTLILLDKNGKEVWKRVVYLFEGTEPDSHSLDTEGADFVDKHRKTLIQRFLSVMEVADCLICENMITNEVYDNIEAKPTNPERVRELYRCLDSAGRAAKQKFYTILELNHRCLVDELKSGQAE